MYNPYVEDYETGKALWSWVRGQTPATPEQDNYAFQQILHLPRPHGFGIPISAATNNAETLSQEASQPPNDPNSFTNSQGGRRKKKNYTKEGVN
jgi:hypothetical protein